MTKQKQHSGHGGKRKNQTGRPKKQTGTVSDATKTAIIKAAKKLKKEFGIPIEEAMLRLCYDKKTQDTVKASIWKSYLEAMVVKETKSEHAVEDRRGPRIGLPPIAGEDPALKVVGKG